MSAALVAAGALLLSGCSSSSNPPAAGSTAASPSAAAPAIGAPEVSGEAVASAAPVVAAVASGAPMVSAAAAGADLKTATTKLGTVIVDATGMTVYYFKPDVANSGKSACAGACVTAWPPVAAASATPVAVGVTAELGVITLADGARQVTVDGRPVYTFAGDKAPGQVNGQEVKQAWFVVKPDGTQIGS